MSAAGRVAASLPRSARSSAVTREAYEPFRARARPPGRTPGAWLPGRAPAARVPGRTPGAWLPGRAPAARVPGRTPGAWLPGRTPASGCGSFPGGGPAARPAEHLDLRQDAVWLAAYHRLLCRLGGACCAAAVDLRRYADVTGRARRCKTRRLGREVNSQ